MATACWLALAAGTVIAARGVVIEARQDHKVLACGSPGAAHHTGVGAAARPRPRPRPWPEHKVWFHYGVHHFVLKQASSHSVQRRVLHQCREGVSEGPAGTKHVTKHCRGCVRLTGSVRGGRGDGGVVTSVYSTDVTAALYVVAAASL